MPSFHYVALNKESAELSGVIEGPDQPSAAHKLNNLGLSVVSMQQVEGVLEHPDIDKTKVLEFEAIDQYGKRVVGTITAASAREAFRKLYEIYQLNVSLLARSGLDAGTRKKEGESLLNEVRDAYAREKEQEKKQQELLQRESEKQRAEKQKLLATVDQTVTRIQGFLSQYGNEIKTEERAAIQSFIDQLARIKDSTNLDHIRSTCARMIEHIQRQELFVNEQQKQRESARLKIDTHGFLDELKKTGLKKDISMGDMVEKMKSFRPLARLVELIGATFAQRDPVLKELALQRAANTKSILTYLRIMVIGSNKVIRSEALASLQTLRQERAAIKEKIAARRALNKASTPRSADRLSPRWLFGWLLSFYLIAYFVSYPLTIKKVNITSALPSSVFFYESFFAKSITLLLFFLYATAAASQFWFNKGQAAHRIAYGLTAVLFAFLAINLF